MNVHAARACICERSRAVILRIPAQCSNDVNVGRNVIFSFSKSGREKTKIKALQSGLIKEKDPLCAARLWSDYMGKEQGAEITFSLQFRLIYGFRKSWYIDVETV